MRSNLNVIGMIELSSQSHGCGQIVRPNKHGIDAFDIQNIVYASHGIYMLNLNRYENVFVGRIHARFYIQTILIRF